MEPENLEKIHISMQVYLVKYCTERYFGSVQ